MIVGRLALHGGDPVIAGGYTYPFPGLWGWLALVAEVVAYDTWAEWTHHPTMSSTYGWALSRPVAGPVVFGVTCGTVYHLWQEARRQLSF